MALRSDLVRGSLRTPSLRLPKIVLLCCFVSAAVLCGSEKTALASTIYWSAAGTGKIQAMESDRSNLRTIVAGGMPTGIALDLAAQELYWV